MQETQLKVKGLYEREANPELQEFLQVMKPRSGASTWANDDSVLPVSGLCLLGPLIVLVLVVVIMTISDGNTSHHSKKAGRMPRSRRW